MANAAYHIINWCWIVFLVYWILAAFRGKAVTERQDWAVSLNYKIPCLLGAFLLWGRHLPGRLTWELTPVNEAIGLFGAFVCVAGLAVAIWARRTLAGNWSSNVTFKQNHELIKTGPYRFARHPIYTGILLLCVGTAIAVGQLHSWLGVAFMFIGFWIKLKGEEALMLRHFPDSYPTYRKEVKAIVPFIL